MTGVGLLVAGVALAAIGAAAVAYLELSGGGPAASAARSYVGWLDRRLRFVRARVAATRVASAQAALGSALLVAALAMGEPLLLVACAGVVVVPPIVAERARARRVVALEAQLEGFLLVLSNGLHTSPSVGEALAEGAALVGAPLSEEIDLVSKEHRLGTSLEQALRQLSTRVASPPIASALASLLIARKTGGDLPRMLAETASALREITRLEGVLSAKTSEARAQAYVMSAVPFVAIGAIHAVDPEWLAPLARSPLGLGITGAAVALWVAAILFARRVLSVQL